ncbi:hypothetical protein BJ508DRAFT_351289 [Ascobolus immersus RN42]|uniref:Uncharacterized protein n=1 Tax=Ascobolus immersus RN42 TaxID=1160509 RepID=A0A3N4HUX0_ASCIM|nr:hypothetical protein BJ508DRAFT_351289 [Ascobolus immersus RN42]
MWLVLLLAKALFSLDLWLLLTRRSFSTTKQHKHNNTILRQAVPHSNLKQTAYYSPVIVDTDAFSSITTIVIISFDMLSRSSYSTTKPQAANEGLGLTCDKSEPPAWKPRKKQKILVGGHKKVTGDQGRAFNKSSTELREVIFKYEGAVKFSAWWPETTVVVNEAKSTPVDGMDLLATDKRMGRMTSDARFLV